MIPRDSVFDATFSFFRQGYPFVGRRCQKLGSKAFRSRLLLRPVTFMMGEEAAQRFYDGASFTRIGAMPQTTLRLLQDKGSVQSLDVQEHAHRKALFIALGANESAKALGDAFETAWHASAAAWRQRSHVVLRDELPMVLTVAACHWAGIGARFVETDWLAPRLDDMVAAAGSPGPRAWYALLRRRGVENWAQGVILRARLSPGTKTPVARIALHENLGGGRPNEEVAAVELINLLRPIVAVSRFLIFAALALHEHPDAASWLREAPRARARAFAEEVRRFYPFFPVIGGRVRKPFVWSEHRFPSGAWVVLGLHATNHDPDLWPEPERFKPERFLDWKGSGFDLIPQGAGDAKRDHRCPGEAMTLELLERMIALLLAYDIDVPEQDLRVPLNHFPTGPVSGLAMRV